MLSENEWKPLKLIALDDEDLQVFSECLYGAITPLSEMLFIKSEKRFIMTIERFTWECANGKDANLRQVLTAVVINDVVDVNIKVANKSETRLLSLNSIAYEKNFLIILFNDGHTIVVKVRKLECKLEDIGKPLWPAISPSHIRTYKK